MKPITSIVCFIIANSIHPFTTLGWDLDCGKPLGFANLDGKIVGGYDVGYYKYPWFVSLSLDDVPWCGGALIGPNVVATAAHCFDEFKGHKGTVLEDVFEVKLGIYNHCVSEPTQKSFKVKKVEIHEKYATDDPYYDIALLILLGNTTSFQPVCLPPKTLGDRTRGKDAIIIGLGTIKYGSSKYPCQMHEGRILIYDDKTCKDMIFKATTDKPDRAFKHAFCAGYKSGRIDSCQGDSGGPALILTPQGRYALLGITSFGYDCARKNRMGIYTDVSHFLDWIKEKSGLQSQFLTEASNTTVIPDTVPTVKNVSVDISEGAPAVTDFPVFPWTTAPTFEPPYVYPVNGEPGNNAGNGNKWPPKRIIIEFKKRGKKIKTSKLKKGKHKKTNHHKKQHKKTNHNKNNKN